MIQYINIKQNSPAYHFLSTLWKNCSVYDMHFLLKLIKRKKGEGLKQIASYFHELYTFYYLPYIQYSLDVSIWWKPGLLWRNQAYQVCLCIISTKKMLSSVCVRASHQLPPPAPLSPLCHSLSLSLSHSLSLTLSGQRNLRSCKSWPDLSLGLNTNKSTGWSCTTDKTKHWWFNRSDLPLHLLWELFMNYGI